jgi:hypothetical protein
VPHLPFGTQEGSGWIRLGRGRVVEARTGRIAVYDSLTSSLVHEQALLGMADDGRTFVWIGEDSRGEPFLVLSDLQTGSSVAHRLGNAAAVLGVAQDGPPLRRPAPPWVAKLFRTASKPGDALRLLPRTHLQRAGPALVKSSEGTMWSTSCVDAFALGPILMRDLKLRWGADTGRDGERPFEKRGDVYSVYDCRTRRTLHRPLHERMWFFDVEHFSFALATNDAGGLSFGFLGRKGDSTKGPDDESGRAVAGMIADRLSSVLQSPRLSRYINLPGARPASPRSRRGPCRRRGC